MTVITDNRTDWLLAPSLAPTVDGDPLQPLYDGAAREVDAEVQPVADERHQCQTGFHLHLAELAQLGQYSGESGVLSARVAGAEKSLRALVEAHPKDAETKQFAGAIGARLADLAAAITASESMPPARRRTAQAAVSDQLDGIEADLLARLGVG